MDSKRIKNIKDEIISNQWASLHKVNFDYQLSNGDWVNQTRESYNRGDGATILLYNIEKKTVILTKQFRLSTFLNDNKEGMLIESCAGMLDEDDPETCIIREVQEETGFRIHKVRKVFEAYASPGAITEKLHYFIAEYRDDMKVSKGGGLEIENEDIEVLEIPFSKALELMKSGEIQDAKTIILLQYAQIHNLL